MTDSAEMKELVKRGKAAARVGRLDEAREYLGHAIERAPDSVEAWLALAAVETEPAGKIACFETVLELDPGNVEASLGLEMLRQDEKPGEAADKGTEDELETLIAQVSRQLDEAVGPPPRDELPFDDNALFCANHPTVETMLRCNRCGKPICTRCAVQTPVGYRCKQCVGQQQAVFYTGGVLDYVIGGAISLVLGGAASFLMTRLGVGVWFIALILGPAAGVGIAEVVRLAVRRRRSRYLWIVVAVAMVVGSLPALVQALFYPVSLISLGLFLFLAVGAAVARLR